MRWRIRPTSLFLATGLLLLLAATPVPALAAPGDPDVVTGSVTGIDLTGTYTTVAKLAVPAGSWVAWAELDNMYGQSRTLCRLSAGTLGDVDKHVASVRQIAGDDGYHQLVLNVAHSSRAKFNFLLACRTQLENPFPPNGHIGMANLVAMRAGTLTRYESSGTTTLGSGSPQVLYRAIDTAHDLTASGDVVGSLPLDGGIWWVRALVQARLGTDAYSSDAQLLAECKLSITNELGGPTVDIGRAALGGFDGAFLTGDSEAMTETELAVRTAHNGNANVRCQHNGGDGDVVVDSVRMVAIKVGTMEIPTPDGLQSFGHGSPVLMRVNLPGPQPIPLYDWRTIGTLPGSGSWFIAGKTLLSDSGLVGPHDYPRCRIQTSASNFPRANDPGFEKPRTRLLMAALDLPAHFQCIGNTVTAYQTWFLALKAGSVVNESAAP